MTGIFRSSERYWDFKAVKKVCLEDVVGIVRSAENLFENKEDSANIHKKGRANFVTEVDLHVQNYLQTVLGEKYPDIQFMGEEKDNSGLDLSGLVWILDPVDGTTNLVHDRKESCISLALAENHRVILGVVFNPDTGELYQTERGAGAYLNGKKLHVSAAETLADCLVEMGTAPYYHQYADWTFDVSRELFLRSQDVRRGGSAALSLAHIAAGNLDVMFEKILQPWDYAAGSLLLEEAGGMLTDLEGKPLDCCARSSLLATNGAVHREALEVIRAVPAGEQS